MGWVTDDSHHVAIGGAKKYSLTVEVLAGHPPWVPYPPSPLEGAKVFVDGSLVGVTDENGRVSARVTEGTHTVRAEKSGYHPVERFVTVPEQTFVQLILSPMI